MGFLKMLEKKNVPDELPALITEEIKRKSEETKVQNVKEEIKQEIQAKTTPEFKETNNQNNNASLSRPIPLPENQIKQDNLPEIQIKQENKDALEQKPEIKKSENSDIENEIQIKKESIPEEKNYPKICKDSFFIKLQENLSKEMGSIDKLEEWYNKKLLPKDTLSEMKSHWENQKSSSVIQALGSDFQDKITKKISLLQELEKSWQDIYFDLIEKEEQIKEQERELKKMLAEFIGFCKKRMKNEKTKEKKETPNKKRRSR